MSFLDKTGLARLWANILALVNSKVNKVEGKGLSTNDFTDIYKGKLDGLSDQVNIGTGNTFGNIDNSSCGEQNKGRMIIGNNNTYNGENGACIGYGLNGRGSQLLCGYHNDDYGTLGGVVGNQTSDSKLLVVGAGYEHSRVGMRNVFTVDATGASTASVSNVSNGDYAEWFEWEDGNPDNEDRRGHFVTLVGEKIRIATSEDDYILGVVSTAPGVVGDVQELEWGNKYLTDVYGAKLYEEVIVPDRVEGERFIPGGLEEHLIINPAYNPNINYVPRSQRPEWTTIGLLGKIVIDDDGTCVAGGRCKPNADGIATNATEGYYVMSRIDKNHIKVLIK